MTARRLSALDGSFLRMETENAPMHVGWRATFAPPGGRARPTVEALRASIAGRLEAMPTFRQRLASHPLAWSEPYWVDDERFDLGWHVIALSEPDEELSPERFARLADAVLSRPLERHRPLWEVHLAPRLEGGGIGMVCKIHHALVDGMSAVDVGLLLFDVAPDAPDPAPVDWTPAPAPSQRQLAMTSLATDARESLRTATAMASAARAPHRSAVRIADSLRRAALAMEADVVRSAGPSYLNVPVTSRRSLASFAVPLAELLGVREAASGAVRGRPTLNDVCLAVAAGALRAHAAERELPSPPLKAMVPVSVRGDGERGRMGNRISFAFVDLPLDVAEPADRLEAVRRQTTAFKESGRPRGFGLLLDALATLPGPARGRAARLAASPRSYNLVVSNVPGPREPLYMLGAQLLEAYPVVPLSEDHALSIGIFSYRDHAFFGLYADPVALAGVDRMPALLGDSLAELRDAVRREGPAPARRSGLRPPERRAAGVPALAEVAP